MPYQFHTSRDMHAAIAACVANGLHDAPTLLTPDAVRSPLVMCMNAAPTCQQHSSMFSDCECLLYMSWAMSARALRRCTLLSPCVTTLMLSSPREDEWRVGYLPVRP